MLKRTCEKKRLNKLDIPLFCKIVLLLFFGLIYVPFANADDVNIFSNHNKNVVHNLEFKTTTFQLTRPMFITRIETYHWNDQKGTPPGKIGIRSVGVWQAKGSPGMHNTPNAYWTVFPNIRLEPGIYAITDSDPATWSQNSGSGGFGFVKVFGKPVNGSSSASSQPTTTSPPEKVISSVVGTWTWFNGKVITLTKNGIVLLGGNQIGNYSCTGNICKFRWNGGNYIDTLTLSDDGKKLDGTNQNGTHVWGNKR